jgi:predicted metal-binding membrane protein
MGVGPGTMGLSLAAFLALWVVMMTAMMFPSVAPMVVVGSDPFLPAQHAVHV